MPTNSTKTSDAIWASLVFAVCLFATASCQRGDPQELVAAETLKCNFRTGRLDRSHCGASIYQVIVKPSTYFGSYVYTHGFIRVENGVGVVIVPTPYTFESNDSFGCIAISSVKEVSSASGTDMKQDGVYAASVGGRLDKPQAGICAARMFDAVVTSARKIEQ